MARSMTGRLVCCLTVFSLAIAVGRPVFGAEADPDAKKAAVQKSKRTGTYRLPPYHAKVVNDEQRDKIYKIQEEYGPRIKVLRDRLKMLLGERNQKIAAVLSPEQQEQVKEARARARQNRRKLKEKSAPPKPPAEAPPTESKD